MSHWSNYFNLINQATKSIENAIEKVDNGIQNEDIVELYGLFFPEGIKLLLFKANVIGNLSPQILWNIYDVLPILISEAGVIRGVRYIGKRKKNIEPYGYLKIRKISRSKRKRGENVKIHKQDELYGTFITWGYFEKLDQEHINEKMIAASYILSHIPTLPLLKQKDAKSGFKASTIFPGTFSFMRTYYFGEKVYLTPFTSFIMLDFENAKEEKGELLGSKNVRYINVKANFVIYNPTINAFQLSNAFPAVLPAHLLENFNEICKASKQYKKIITGATGIIESSRMFLGDFKTLKILKKERLKNRIILIDFPPINLKIKSLLLLGKIRHSPKREIPLFIELSCEELTKIISRFRWFTESLKKEGVQLKVYHSTLIDKILERILKSEEWLVRDGDIIRMLTPPLISLYTFHNFNLSSLIIIEKLTRSIDLIIKGLSIEEVKKITCSASKIMTYYRFIRAWSLAHKEQKNIIKTLGLAQIF